MVNSLRMAYTKQGNWFVPDTIGFNAASALGLQYAKANVFPQINVGGGGLVLLATELPVPMPYTSKTSMIHRMF